MIVFTRKLHKDKSLKLYLVIIYNRVDKKMYQMMIVAQVRAVETG